jgi:flagellar biosynthesis protein FlhA
MVQREELAAQADFFGAMDGASKFVRGDAIAGIVITLINICGGLAIGLSGGMSLPQSGETFTKLTIGDGLVTQLPALLISVAAGLLVTRSSRRVDLPRESVNQLFSRPLVLIITASFLCLLIFTQLPKFPLLVLAAGCIAGAYLLIQNGQAFTNSEMDEPASSSVDVTIDKLLGTDLLEMELGISLIRLADPQQAGDLLPSISRLRKQIAAELGVIVPKVRVRDNLQLKSEQFRILVHGNVVDAGQIKPNCLLAIDEGSASAPVPGAIAVEVENSPGRQAFWVQPSSKRAVEQAGYRILTPTEVLADRMAQVARSHAAELLTRDAVRQLIEETQKTSPAVVSELIPGSLTLSEVQAVLKRLLADGISIRPLTLILESLGDRATKTKIRWQLIEYVRQQLARHITARLISVDQTIRALSMSADLQNHLLVNADISGDEVRVRLTPQVIEGLARAIASGCSKMASNGLQPILLVQQRVRPIVAYLTGEVAPELFVLGSKETAGVEIENMGEISVELTSLAESTAA